MRVTLGPIRMKIRGTCPIFIGQVPLIFTLIGPSVTLMWYLSNYPIQMTRCTCCLKSGQTHPTPEWSSSLARCMSCMLNSWQTVARNARDNLSHTPVDSTMCYILLGSSVQRPSHPTTHARCTSNSPIFPTSIQQRPSTQPYSVVGSLNMRSSLLFTPKLILSYT